MIARWHLDLLALSVVVGLVAVLIEARSNRRHRRAAHGDDGAAGPDDLADRFTVEPLRIPPAAIIGFALLVGGLLGLIDVLALAALSILAGAIACRRPTVSAAIALLYLATPAVEGFDLPMWLHVLLGLALGFILVIPTGGPTDAERDADVRDTDACPPTDATDLRAGAAAGTAVVPVLIAAALWTAAPDTELPLAAGGALLVPAIRDLVARRGLRPDPVALATVMTAAAIGFVGRPAGAVVLALVPPIWWITNHGPDPVTRSPRSRFVRLTATIVSLTALGLACRTGGLHHHLDRSIPPTVAAAAITLGAAAVTTAFDPPRRSSAMASKTRPSRTRRGPRSPT